MNKKHKIVLIETDKHAADFPKLLSLRTNSRGKLLQSNGALSDALIRHLYILSDDEIKEDDWAYSAIYKSITKVTKEDVEGNFLNTKNARKIINKIIATTNTELYQNKNGNSLRELNILNDIYQIPQDFIEMYIKEWNKGNIIKEVLLQYDLPPCGGNRYGHDETDEMPIPKISPNNTVIINL